MAPYGLGHICWLQAITRANAGTLPIRLLTIKRLGQFFKNVFFFRNVVHHKCDIFYMKLVQYNESLVSIVDTDGLVL